MRSCFNYLPVYSNNAVKKCVQSYGYIQFIIQNIKVNEPRILYLSSSHSVNIWALRTTIKFTFQINSYLDRRSYWCEEAITRSKKLWPLVRDIVPGEYYNKANIWHWNRAFTQWEGEGDQTSGCQDNWQRHLDHTAGTADWHSLPLIVFPPSLCHISLSPFLTITHIHSVCVFALISPPTIIPWVTMQCLFAIVILGTWEIKSLLMTDDHRSMQKWAAVCNDTDTLKAVSVQPCQVTGWISSSVMKYIVKVLVNKASVLSSSTHRAEVESS